MFEIKEVSDLDMAFGGNTDELLPPMKDVFPSKLEGTWAFKLFSDLFFSGVTGLKLNPREGVDTEKAMRHIKAIIVSWGPQHEHKEAGIVFLLDQWFTGATWIATKKEQK